MNEELLRKIIKKFGKEKQVMQAIEEMLELTKELIKNINRDKDNKTNIILEIADVQIMLAQLVILYNIDAEKLNGAIEYKMQHIKKMIAEVKE